MAKSLEEIYRHMQEQQNLAKQEQQKQEQIVRERAEMQRAEWLRRNKMYDAFIASNNMNNTSTSTSTSSAGGGKPYKKKTVTKHNGDHFISKGVEAVFSLYVNPDTNTYFSSVLDSTNGIVYSPIDLEIPSNWYYYYVFVLQGGGVLHFGAHDEGYMWYVFIDVDNTVKDSGNILCDNWDVMDYGQVIGVWYIIDGVVTMKTWNGVSDINVTTYEDVTNFNLWSANGDDCSIDGYFLLQVEHGDSFNFYIFKNDIGQVDITDKLYLSGYYYGHESFAYVNSEFFTLLIEDGNGLYSKLRIVDKNGNLVDELDLGGVYNNYSWSSYGTDKFKIDLYINDNSINSMLVRYGSDLGGFLTYSYDPTVYTNQINYMSTLRYGMHIDSVIGSENLITVLCHIVDYNNNMYVCNNAIIIYHIEGMVQFGTYVPNTSETNFSIMQDTHISYVPMVVVGNGTSDEVSIMSFKSNGTTTTHGIGINRGDINYINAYALNDYAVFAISNGSCISCYVFSGYGQYTTMVQSADNNFYYGGKYNIFYLVDVTANTIYYITDGDSSFIPVEVSSLSSSNSYNQTIHFVNGYHYDPIISIVNNLDGYIISNNGIAQYTIPNNSAFDIRINDEYIIIVYLDDTWKFRFLDKDANIVRDFDTNMTDGFSDAVIGNRVVGYTEIEGNIVTTLDMFIVTPDDAFETTYNYSGLWIMYNDYEFWMDW